MLSEYLSICFVINPELLMYQLPVFQMGFVDFYEGGPERRNESPWPTMKQLCGYAVGAVGVLTLGAILANKS